MQNLARRMQQRLLRSRITLYSIMLPLAAYSLWGTADSIWRIVIVLLGFSIIIFFHELGHFIVARMCSVKCLAFSLGIGPRAFGWRKGGGLTFGRDPYDPDVKARQKEKEANDAKRLEHMEAATTHSDLPTSAEIPPHPRQVGDCDYRLSYLPLGGYVRMLGQDDMDPTKVSQDPHAFNMRPIWQRMCIVSAGVIMNIIFAAVAFAIIFMVGVKFPVAQIGFVDASLPAYGKLQMGDIVTSIDGKHARPGSFVEHTDIVIDTALSSGERDIRFGFIRPGQENKGEQFVNIRPVSRPDRGPFLMIGVQQMPSLNITSSDDNLKADIEHRRKPESEGGLNDPEGAKEIAKLQPGGHITAINGQPVTSYLELYKQVQESNGKPVELTVTYNDKRTQNINITPKLLKKTGIPDYPAIFGLTPRTKITKVDEGEKFLWLFRGAASPAAKAGLKANDEIKSIGARLWPTQEQVRDAVANSGGKELEIVVLREGKELPLKVLPVEKKGRHMIGVGMTEAIDDLAVSNPSGGSGPLADLIGPGEELKLATIDNQPVKNWDDAIARLLTKKAGDNVELGFLPASATSNDPGTQPAARTKTLVMTAEAVGALNQMHYMLNLPVETLQRLQKATNVVDATMMGMEHTKKFVLQVDMTLAGLFRGTVGADNLHGMVGITYVGYQVQERGMAWFWYLMAMVSVNLAVANFLPLPIVDGGLFLLLILEKIRGKPLSLKVQSAIQVVGIVLLAGMFLFVTWNDLQLFK